MAFGQGSSNRSNPLRTATGDKPKREVFPTSEIAHKWAHATQSRARNAQGNLFFDGDTIYSYRTSWPIARIYRRKVKGAMFVKDNPACNLVLINSDRYSVTTAQHTSQVERAVSHLPFIRVPHVTARYDEKSAPDHGANLQYLTRESAAELARAHRALTEWRASQSIGRARDLLADAVRYMDFFGIRRARPVFPKDAAQRAMERVRRIENPDPVRDAAKIKARERSKAARRATLQSVFDQYSAQVAEFNAAMAARVAPDAAEVWRETGNWPHVGNSGDERPYLHYSDKNKLERAGFELPRISSLDRPSETLLRVDGETIVTSLGARVPLAAAPFVWNLVRRAVRNGGYAADRSGLSRVRIGDYPLDRIDADGTLHAGCHTIKFAELELLARKLGLVGDTEENNV